MFDDIPRGPEDLPLRSIINEHQLVIILKDVKSGRRIREERINYSDPASRKWLGKITFYATTHGYSVETFADKDYYLAEELRGLD